jgi:hypothetical protein
MMFDGDENFETLGLAKNWGWHLKPGGFTPQTRGYPVNLSFNQFRNSDDTPESQETTHLVGQEKPLGTSSSGNEEILTKMRTSMKRSAYVLSYQYLSTDHLYWINDYLIIMWCCWVHIHP